MIIKVKVGNAQKRVEVEVNTAEETVRDAFNKAGMDVEYAQLHLQGRPLDDDALDETFEDLGVATDVNLTAIIKQSNA